MAFQSIDMKLPILWNPGAQTSWTTRPAAMSSTVYPRGFIFRAPKAGTLRSVGFNFNTVVTAEDVNVELRDVSESTHIPSATVDAFRLIPSASVVASTWVTSGILSDDGTDGGAKKVVTRGQRLCVSFTWPGSLGNISFRCNQIEGFGRDPNFPYGRSGVSGGAMTVSQDNGQLKMALEYDDGTFPFIPLMMPMVGDSALVTIQHNGGVIDEFGFRFQVPFDCKVSGAWLSKVGLCEFDVRILEDNGGQLVNVNNPANLSTAGMLFTRFSGEVTLLANTWYRHVYLAKTTGVVFQAAVITLDQATHREAWGEPALFEYTERYQGGSWTTDPLRRFDGGLVISAINDGA